MAQAPSFNLGNPSPVAAAFDVLAPEYDSIWTYGFIGELQRAQVRREILPLFHAGEKVLEIGCGTGADAVGMAQAGIQVHAIDIAQKMLRIAGDRVEREHLQHLITLEQRSIEQLAELDAPNPFDGAISNFGVFNCIHSHRSAVPSLAKWIRPGGWFALCIMGRFCLWETVWYLLHGRLPKALRRPLAGREGCETRLSEGPPIRVYYPTMNRLIADFRTHFEFISSCGVGVLIPPSYMEAFARKRKRSFNTLAVLDERIRNWPLVRGMGDHRFMLFKRKALT